MLILYTAKYDFYIHFMEEQFELPVEYKGEIIMYNSQLLLTGFTYKFIVDINGKEIIFEPDES